MATRSEAPKISFSFEARPTATEAAGETIVTLDVSENGEGGDLRKIVTLDELKNSASDIGREFSSLAASLTNACREATSITTAHMESYLGACEEVTTVADAHLDCAKRTRARTLALISSLPELEELKAKHDQLNEALTVLEQNIDLVIAAKGQHV